LCCCHELLLLPCGTGHVATKDSTVLMTSINMGGLACVTAVPSLSSGGQRNTSQYAQDVKEYLLLLQGKHSAVPCCLR
jgi:hypothetical protein